MMLALLIAACVSCQRATEVGAEGQNPSGGGISSTVAPPDATRLLDARFGQTIYVPVYSHIRVGDSGEPYRLAITMTIRNPDPARTATILSARYFDDRGRLIKDFVPTPQNVGPLAAMDLFVEESNVEGGSSASFLVEWASEHDLVAPIVEAVMIGTRNQQGVSFTSTGRVVTSRSRGDSGKIDLRDTP